MPIILPQGLPAIERLKAENSFVVDESLADSQKIRPLRIAILNLMPLKEATETDFARLLANCGQWVEAVFMTVGSHTSKHTSAAHMKTFYKTFAQLRQERFDGLIVTGAPVEHLAFEDVDYWGELSEIFTWSRTHVRATLYICWSAQAGLYYHFGIPKYGLPKKMFGIFPQQTLAPQLPIFRGFDDVFAMPHSRHTEIRRADIEGVDALSLIAEGAESGVSMVMARDGREIFITGHMEYAPETLDQEYRRDRGKRADVEMPVNYYRDDNPANAPLVTWRAHANLLFSNWINWLVAPPDNSQ